ncbi:MAG: hypothetical protein K2R98_23500 [Gemmataceae bacterium]|nr:hypothetical protein [Gemmataceae bacterium]
MKTFASGLMVVTLVGLTGCGSHGTPGGPGVSSGSSKPMVGSGDNTFSLDPPNTATTVKQGEARNVVIGIKRGKNFNEDVAIKVDGLPKGVTIEPAAPVIKHGDKEASISVKAAEDAALGDFTVKLVGHPSKGADATNDVKITVEKK